MQGPFDKMFGHSAFDFNHDGKIDAAEWAFINDTIFNEDNGEASELYDEEEIEDELEEAGLSREELEFMDEDERREALEDAGLDPDDFMDEF